ncbi:MAG: HAD family hydrolase [Bacteroidota bacterium]
MLSYKEKLNDITTFIFDVDGVLTTGEVQLTSGDLVRTLNSKDGYALQLAAKLGYKIFIITGGKSEAVKSSLLGLGITEVHLSSSNKVKVFEDITHRHGISAKEVLYMGDDIPDIPLLKLVGLAACPQDAAVDVKSNCDYQSPFNGGKNCVRDVIEQVLRLNGQWLSAAAFEW